MGSQRAQGAARSLERDAGLWRSAAWTRRIAAAAVISCGALMAGFAHVLPSIDLHGLRGDDSGGGAAQHGTVSGGGQGSVSGGGQNSSSGGGAVQAPGAGGGAGQVVSGAS